MHVGTDLTTKALLALEEACHAARYCRPDRTHALRFALAYLYALRPGDQAPFVDFWQELASDNSVFRHQNVDRALGKIYEHAGQVRDDRAMFAMWKIAQAKYAESPPR